MQCLLQWIHPTKTRRHVEPIHSRFFFFNHSGVTYISNISTLVSPTSETFLGRQKRPGGKRISPWSDTLIVSPRSKSHRFGFEESISLPPSCISNFTICWYLSGYCFCCYDYCCFSLFVFKLPITYIKDTNMSAAPFLKTSSTTSSFLDVSLSMKISSKGRREGASRAHFRRKEKAKRLRRRQHPVSS